MVRRRSLLLLLVTMLPAAASAGPWTRVLRAHGITDPRVLQAFDQVRRADFLPDAVKHREYEDAALPIGDDQTTSQPSLIALMIQQMQLPEECRVLEVGTGSGYQTALLARICREVYSIEIVPSLGRRAASTLAALGYKNAHVRVGDGYAGWPDAAPFDGITVGAGAEAVPKPLVKQLAPEGRLVIPVGPDDGLKLLIVRADGSTESSIPVRFVPLTGPNAEGDRRR
jgi:protein-L-isoaspartate(D-aspartate) O-methyltransferase